MTFTSSTYASLLKSLALLVALLSAAPMAGLELELRGSIRSRYGLFSPEIAGPEVAGAEGDEDEDESLELRVRPELLLYLEDWLTANITLRAQRGWGLAEDTLGEDDLELDRLYFDIELGQWDLRLGRQAINFGQAQIWNPVDLVDSNTALDFDIVKQGIDAVRASYSISSTANVLGLVAFPDGGSLSLLRGEVLLGNTEVGLLAAVDRRDDDVILGCDLKGDLGVGWWVEGAYHDRQDDTFHQLVLGFDYSFPVFRQLYIAAQYYRDSSGGTNVDNYPFAEAASGRRFLARQYGSLIASLSLDELTSINSSVIYNLEDQSYVATAGLARYFFDNLEVTLRASLFRGSGPGEFNPVAGSPLFGRQPTEAYEMYLEWSF